ncbi:uncharacterized protein LOC124898083 [Capsicum annuum]|uniref:uncharacterized protein LOC124898083 n=1 Tax=Capsicum annuum TaxID=4072 RepID=UPI001FB14322|nr:uncharacterized protein LOC124898083 [Capsicum annuum]
MVIFDRNCDLSITEYFEKKRAIANSLAESLYIVQDDDFISFVLKGLDSSFEIFKAALNMCSGRMTLKELLGLLLQEEEHLTEEICSIAINTQFGSTPSHALLTQNLAYPPPSPPVHNTNQSSILGSPPLSNLVAYNSHNHAQSMVPQQYSYSAFSQPNNRHSKHRVLCQICGKTNHEARICYHHSNEKDYTPTRTSTSWSTFKQAHFASSSAIVDTAWYFDSTATHHVTSDMANLTL